MTAFVERGRSLRVQAKALVHEFMRNSDLCQPGRSGMKQSEIFRACGFDWGSSPNATSSHQQYWLVALMRQLEAEGTVERLPQSGPWRLKQQRA